MISDRRLKDNGNILNKSKAVYDALDEKVREMGFTLEEATADYNVRQQINIISMKNWADNYKCSYTNIARCDLW